MPSLNETLQDPAELYQQAIEAAMRCTAQLIARASPAMQHAEREILNLRLCNAHPFIIHMQEVGSYRGRACIGS